MGTKVCKSQVNNKKETIIMVMDKLHGSPHIASIFKQDIMEILTVIAD